MLPPLFHGTRHAIVSGHPLASLAGRDVLARGGSAADAAIAAAAVLAVVLPQACTLGGDAFALTYEARTGRICGLNASGRSGRNAVRRRFDDGIPERGAAAIAVPGVVDGWGVLHARHGRLPWTSLLAPAIALADEGFAVSPGLAAATRQYRALILADDGMQAVIARDQGELEAGTRWRQPALARTLAQVAEEGPDTFYRGAVARSLMTTLEARGAAITAEDLAHHRSQWVEPIVEPYRGLDVALMPPNSYGLYMALQLRALVDHPEDLRGADAVRLGRLITAMREAFAVGDRRVADPDMQAEQPLAARTPPGQPNRGGTAVVSVVDRDGNAAVLVQSIFLLFGSAVADAASGVIFNNRMIGFVTTPGHANEVGPGKRPAHTLNPVIVTRDHSLAYCLGTPGGPGQTLTLTQVLSGLVDRRMSLPQAIAAPRWSTDLEGEVLIERGFGDAVLGALNGQGTQARFGESTSPFFGSAEIIERRSDGTLVACADWRREASALAE